MRAIVGLVVFNITLLGVGVTILWGLAAIRSWLDLVRLAGVAYLLGLSIVIIVLTLELVLGVPVNETTGSLTLLGLAAAGLAFGIGRGHGLPSLRPTDWELPRITLFVGVLLAGIVAYFEELFRGARLASTLPEWDGWAHWIPKAKAIYYFGGVDPELLTFIPPQSYPPGLPAVHALAFHAMGSADDVTLHLQYWFYAVGFIAALGGLLATRVRQTILVSALLLILLAPSFVTRMTWTYVDLPLGYLVAIAALLVILWIEERHAWQLAAATVLFAGAMLTKREGMLFAACVLVAAFAASWTVRRAVWLRLAVAGGICLTLALPWRIWFTAQGLPGDGPSAGYLGALSDLGRGWPTVQLVVETLFDPEFWFLAPLVAAGAIVLAALARAWVIAIYAGAFTGSAILVGVWTIWSETSLPITQDDAENPVVRMTGTSVLVLCALIPLLLGRAWSVGNERGAGARMPPPGPDAFLWRPLAAWAIVLVPALSLPASMAVGYSGQALPGGWPRFPNTSDCMASPVPGMPVRLVVGYADSYPEANALRERAAVAGLPATKVTLDGCGRLRVFVDDLPSIASAAPLMAKARSARLEPSLESDASG